jgi:hypothetical protein
MRASRVVSLSVLTVGLTVCGIGAAAADTVNSTSSATTSTGSTSSYTHSNDHSFATGSITTSANGVSQNSTKTGIAPDGAAYYRTVSQWANAQGAGENTTSNSTGGNWDGAWHCHGLWFDHDLVSVAVGVL